MRPAAIMLAMLLWAAPAAAQPPPCEASVTGPIGEVIASKGAGWLVSWVIEPKSSAGEESEHFARPGLLVDFAMARGGALDVSGVMTSITRVQDIGAARPPSLSRVTMRATLDDQRPLTWAGNDSGPGEAELVKRLKARWPSELELAILLDGGVVASATFDLTRRPEAERMGREAMGKCGG